jgi:hypothetical protein
MAGSCGCKTAEQCWRSCCCHSLAERLAWARARGIQPPAFELAQAQAMGLDVAWLAKSCRSGESARRCCSAQERGAIAKPLPRSLTETGQGAAATDNVGGIVAWRALACRGQSLHWLAAVPSLIVISPDLPFEILVIDWLGPVITAIAGQCSDIPTVPPPELA